MSRSLIKVELPDGTTRYGLWNDRLEYDVDFMTISDIVKGRTWKNVV
jgi:hypothetical protein